MFDQILIQPLQAALLWMYTITGNLGLSIIGFTVLLRLVLLPITLPSLKATDKMRQLQPEINKIKRKYPKDKVKQQQAQMELFQQHKVNPASGCLPQILQFVFFFALYQVFLRFFNNGHQGVVDTAFFGMDLAATGFYSLAILAAVTQLIYGLMIVPAADTDAETVLADSTKDKKDDKKAEDMTQMAATMQKQMVIMMPIITGFFALRFPAGLALYWITSTIVNIALQYTVSGWGGLEPYLAKIKLSRSK